LLARRPKKWTARKKANSGPGGIRKQKEIPGSKKKRDGTPAEDGKTIVPEELRKKKVHHGRIRSQGKIKGVKVKKSIQLQKRLKSRPCIRRRSRSHGLWEMVGLKLQGNVGKTLTKGGNERETENRISNRPGPRPN